MNSYTLTLYTIASGLCFCLSLVLLVFAQVRRNTYLMRSSALGLVTLGIGFLGAGIGHLMPLWFTVIGMNAVLLSAGLFFYSGIRAFVTQEEPRFDRVGAVLVLLAMPFFAYWGFIDPDGLQRSVVFSAVAALIQGRTTWLLFQHFKKSVFTVGLTFITLFFVVVTVWMAVRGGVLMFAQPLSPDVKATNPTTWPTVFAFNVLISIFVTSLLLIEAQVKKNLVHDLKPTGEEETVRGSLQMLWGIVAVVLVAILSETGIAYLVLYQREQQQLKEQNSLANKALFEHAQQLISQADLVLRATRDLAQKGYQSRALEKFTDNLNIEQRVFQNVYLIDEHGVLILPATDRLKDITATQHDYYRFHQIHEKDELFISPISVGQVSGKLEFRISRRVTDSKGRFSGVVLVVLEPVTLIRYYERFIIGADGVAALLGSDDHRIRARWPLPDVAQLQEPLRSPLWELHRSESGNFSAISMIDGVNRQYFYQRLPRLPLVMVTGFSDADVHRNALASLKPIALGAVLAIAVVLAMAFMLAAALRRRDEQDRFLSMISHELRTPLSVIRMVSGSNAMPESIKGRVLRAVNDMSVIVDSALQADRLRHGRMRANVHNCDLDELLDMVWQNSSEPERILITGNTGFMLRTDAQLLKVVLGNLLDNAIKYSDAGSLIQVRVGQSDQQRKPGFRIDVVNTVGSVGLPDGRQLFNKFYRAPGARGKTGSGLGLHIAEGLTRLLGGNLKYLTVGETIQFMLWIPA